MEILLEDYKRRLKTVTELLEKQRSNGSIIHQRREERLNTKAAEYMAFIVEIERAMARKQPTENANCVIFDVTQQRELLNNFAEWLYYRDIYDDTMTPEEWVNIFLNQTDKT